MDEMPLSHPLFNAVSEKKKQKKKNHGLNVELKTHLLGQVKGKSLQTLWSKTQGLCELLAKAKAKVIRSAF